MKRFFPLLLGIFVLILFTQRQSIAALLQYSPCDTPIPYKIGSIDPKFGLSQVQISADIKTATNILSTAEKKQLFINSEKGELTVNFIYDERQALKTEINQLKTELGQKGSTLQQQINDYEAQVKLLTQKIAAFKATVDKYNKEGGAPPDVYKSLIEQQNQIKAEADALNQRAKELKLSTNDYNLDVSNLNQDVTQFKNEISLKPEEGLYNEGNNTITLYFASDYNELIHTLTHEFGHALGMQHVQDKKAIMYPFTTEFLTLTPDDLGQLSYVCRKQPLPAHWIQLYNKWFFTTVRPLIQHYLNQVKG